MFRFNRQIETGPKWYLEHVGAITIIMEITQRETE